MRFRFTRKGFSNVIVAPFVLLFIFIITFSLFRLQIAFLYQIKNEEVIAAVMRWAPLKLDAMNSCYDAEQALKQIMPQYMSEVYRRGQKIKIKQEAHNRFKVVTVSADYAWQLNVAMPMQFRREYTFYTDFFQSRDYNRRNANLIECVIE